MSLYFSLLSLVCLTAVWAFVEGNRFRQLDRRMSFIEDRLNGNKLDIFELQDAISDVNNTMSEIKNVCLKTDGENLPKPQAKFVDIPQDDMVINNIIHAFTNEKRWIRREFTHIKRQIQKMPELWNVQIQNEITVLKKSTGSGNNQRRQMDTLEERMRRTLRDEIDIIKRSINDVKDDIKDRRDKELLDLSNAMIDMDTKFKKFTAVIGGRVNHLGERLTVVENYKDQQNHSSDTNCGTGWQHFEDFCYQFRSDKLVFDDAVKSCEDDNAYLTDVQSQAEDDFVGELGNGTHMWLGSNRTNTWMRDSKSMQYTNWRRSYSPLSLHTLHTYKFSTGKWGTIYSSLLRLKFVCKKQA